MVEDQINEPFAVINADDFYGTRAIKQMADFLISRDNHQKAHYAMVGYVLRNTLSDYGHVSLGPERSFALQRGCPHSGLSPLPNASSLARELA